MIVWLAVPNSPGCKVMLIVSTEIEIEGSGSAKADCPMRLNPKMILNRKSLFKITFFLHTLMFSFYHKHIGITIYIMCKNIDCLSGLWIKALA